MMTENIDILKSSSFFDVNFYINTYKDVHKTTMDPYEHYLYIGAKEGRYPAILSHKWFKDIISEGKKNNFNPVIYIEKLKKESPDFYELLGIWKKIDYKNFNIIKNSKFFDDEYYKKNHMQSEYLLDPAFHYLLNNCDEKLQVSCDFNHLLKRDIKSSLGKSLLAWERHEKQFQNDNKLKTECILSQEAASESILSIDKIKTIINNDNIKIVSFDIFDTLLCRPVLESRDIFDFMDYIVKENGIDNFSKIRSTIERSTGDLLANIDEIYEYIRVIHKIPPTTIKYLKNIEINIEKNLLKRREEIYELYLYAKSLGKKIICISDMYFSSDFLSEVLIKNGYKVDKIYVSNECMCCKGNSLLFKYVLNKEGIRSENMIHIGDSMIADYHPAQEAGITPVYYPKASEIILSKTKLGIKFKKSKDVFTRMILGFIFNKIAFDYNNRLHRKYFFKDFDEFFTLSIYPVLLGIGLYILNNPDIQKNYRQILFASRDGFKPKLVYDILSQKKALPSKYIYAGRRAYSILGYETFYDYFMGCIDYRKISQQEDSYTETLKLAINDKTLTNKIINHLKIDKETPLPTLQIILRNFSPFEKELNNWFLNAKKSAYDYYTNITDKTDREIIFDIGYSGTISKFLTMGIKKPFDKIYLFSLPFNKEVDKDFKTKTYNILGNNIPPKWTSIIYEELFSPLEGSCIGFNKENIIIENLSFSDEMKNKFVNMEKITENLTTEFIELFGDYKKYFLINDYEGLQSFLVNALFDEANEVLDYLKDIKFPDPISNDNFETLADKISEKMEYPHPFLGTAINSKNIINPWKYANNFECAPRIGIHLHAHNTFVIQEFLAYISDFPYKFDLFLTYTEPAKKCLFTNLFRIDIPNLKNNHIILVKNRGRDIAPWILTLRNYQKDYDLFLHLHEKISVTSNFGTRWRQYLFNNLLNHDIVKIIVKLMMQDKNIGCIFPPPFPDIKRDWIKHNINPFGLFNEKNIASSLLKRMNINEPFVRSKLIYSLGSMLWYKPEALHQLFTFQLDLHEFKPEPVGVGGTLAHAIERILGFICNYNGYTAKMIEKRIS